MAYKTFTVVIKAGESIDYTIDYESVTGKQFWQQLQACELSEALWQSTDGTFYTPGLGAGSAVWVGVGSAVSRLGRQGE